jgi:hypothetical protein
MKRKKKRRSTKVKVGKFMVQAINDVSRGFSGVLEHAFNASSWSREGMDSAGPYDVHETIVEPRTTFDENGKVIGVHFFDPKTKDIYR